MPANDPFEVFSTGGFTARAWATPAGMAAAAATDIAAHVRKLLAAQPQVRMMFAAAPSQAAMLACLVQEPGIDWRRVVAFHMDEYVGLPAGHPARFGNWLHRHLWNHVPMGRIQTIDPGSDPVAAAAYYADLLAEAPLDIVCLGIGMNGHVAFNDPPFADFNDPLLVKLLELHEVSRRQQVIDKCFEKLDDVPTTAITVTIPALMAGRRLFTVVPGSHKREAVERTLYGAIVDNCPASILRKHHACTIYLDGDSRPSVHS